MSESWFDASLGRRKGCFANGIKDVHISSCGGDDDGDGDDDEDDDEDEDAAADNGDDVDADHEEELQPKWNERCSHLCFWRSTVKEGALLWIGSTISLLSLLPHTIATIVTPPS